MKYRINSFSKKEIALTLLNVSCALCESKDMDSDAIMKFIFDSLICTSKNINQREIVIVQTSGQGS